MVLGLHPLDMAVLAGYFLLVAYLGIGLGNKKTKTLSDFFIAGGRWGKSVSFLFVLASAVGGAEAVVVGAGAYRSGVSGIWYWWNSLFATPVYFLFAPIYKRSRVFNLAEFLEMRYGSSVAVLYAFLGTATCVIMIGTFELGVGKIISGLSGLSVDQAVLAASILVAFYVAAGGQMSALLTDLFQGMLCLTVFTFLLLPFLWSRAGGVTGLLDLPATTWSLHSPELTPSYILAFCFAASFGAVSSPYLFGWIVVGKDERTATQCAWAHVWKRVMTILFALYGILFAIYRPGLADPELAWGIVIKDVIPAGLLGLLIASFFAALMSTVDTMATASSALVVDFFLRRKLLRKRPMKFYLRAARIWGFVVIFLAFMMTREFSTVVEFIEVLFAVVSFLCVPLYFGIVWRRANRQGAWACFLVGTSLFAITKFWLGLPLQVTVFVPTFASALAMLAVSRLTRPESDLLVKRFHCILNTPIGKDRRLHDVGIRLPAMRERDDAAEFEAEESLDGRALEDLYRRYARHKAFGPESSIEILKEPGLGWYYRGFVWVLLACVMLLGAVWVGGRTLSYLASGG